jgi:hypothetical protein
MLLAQQLWVLFIYTTLVVILSVGRRGTDVLVLRCVLVAFILGAGVAAFVPIYTISVLAWVLATLLAGLIYDLHSMRPQLTIFSRG